MRQQRAGTPGDHKHGAGGGQDPVGGDDGGPARGAPEPCPSWRVLLVEGDAADAGTLVRELCRHGHDARSVGTGRAAFMACDDADMVLLGLDLPDLDGLEVCREIRAAGDTPVIVVTARGTEDDRVLGLRAGADDYLVRPFGMGELLARIDAVMRRARPQDPAADVISRGPLRIDPRARRISLHGRSIATTRKEFDLLYLLARNPGTVVPRKRLIRQVWGDSWSRRTVDTHVSSLRSKLGASDWIITVRGVGFRLGDGCATR